MSTSFTESAVEEAALVWLENPGLHHPAWPGDCPRQPFQSKDGRLGGGPTAQRPVRLCGAV